MDLLMISPYFPPSGSPQAYQSWRLAKAAARRGFGVTVVAAGGGHAEPDNTHVGSAARPPSCGLEVVPFPPPSTWLLRSRTVVRTHRVLNPFDPYMHLPGLTAVLPRLLSQRRFSMVISVAEPLASHVALQRNLSRARPQQAVYWFSDPVPVTSSKGMMKLYWRRLLCETVARRCVDTGSLVVGVTEEILEPIRSLGGKADLWVLPHSFDEDDWPWPPGEQCEARPVGAAQLTLLHSGALYWERRPYMLLEGVDAAARASPALRGIRVRLQGTVSPEIAQGLSQWQSRVNVVVDGPAEFAESKLAMQSADILCIIDCDLPRNVHLPSKVADYVGACKPILYLGRPDSPTCRLLKPVHPVFAQARSAEEVVGALAWLVQRRSEVRWQDYEMAYTTLASRSLYERLFQRLAR